MSLSNEALVSYFSNGDKFAQNSGIEVLEISPGYARAKMDVQPLHFNSVGTVHGGAVFTLGDFAFAMASNSHGNVALAINVSISFFQKTTEGTLFAEAREINANPKLASYEVRITNQDDELVALFEGMVYRKRDPLPIAE